MNERRIPGVFLVLMVLGPFLFGCTRTDQGGRKGPVLISISQEVAIGQSLVEDIESKNKVTEDSVLAEYPNRVGQKAASLLCRFPASYPPTSDRMAKAKQHMNSFHLEGRDLTFGEWSCRGVESRLK